MMREEREMRAIRRGRKIYMVTNKGEELEIIGLAR